MKKKVCYLAPGLHIFQHLMTSYDPDNDNLIIASDIPNHNLSNFFKYTVRFTNVIYLPEILYQTPYPEKLELWNDIFEKTGQLRQMCQKVLEYIDPEAEVFYYSPSTSISFFILLSLIRERNRDQKIFLWKKQTPAMPQGAYAIRINPLDGIQKRDFTAWSFLSKLGQAAGLRITEVVHHLPGENWDRYVGHGPEEQVGETLLSPAIDWDEIRKKLGLAPPQKMDNSVLYIDSLLHERPEIDWPRTQENINKLLLKKLLEGKNVFVKAHYRSGGLTMLSGTPVNDLVTHLPTCTPVELLMDAYDETLFISSTSGGRPSPGKKSCILPLLVFKTEEASRHMHYLVNKNFGDELKTMTFVYPEDLE